MLFVIDEGMPRDTATLLRRHGHESMDIRDVAPRGISDRMIADLARSSKACIVTRDFDFADIRLYPPQNYAGIVVLTLPNRASREFILATLESFLRLSDVLEHLPGRLAIVEPDRVRLRPAPPTPAP